MENIAVIVYGDGGELGSFKVFAESLKRELSVKYKKIILQYANRDHQLFKLLQSINHTKENIEELHIFSHAIGAGLFLGYKDPAIAARREAVWKTAFKAKRKVTYHQAVQAEVGAIQTDDLQLCAISSQKADLRKRFSTNAFIKIWGCNSGVGDWVYSDNGIVDPSDTSEAYYWRAFNEFNVPKPSIAQALATFFDRKVYGANSGASIEVKYKKKWISSQQFKNNLGHWPSGSLPHRLVPDKGAYNELRP